MYPPKNRGSPSDFELSAGGESRGLVTERGIGGNDGICLDVHFLDSGYGEPLRKMVRRTKAVFRNDKKKR